MTAHVPFLTFTSHLRTYVDVGVEPWVKEPVFNMNDVFVLSTDGT